MHVFIACAPLPASTGMVHGPWGAGHPVTVVAGVGWVVGSVGMVVVMVVTAKEKDKKKKRKTLSQQIHTYSLYFPSVQCIIKSTC